MFIARGEGYWDNRYLEFYDEENLDTQVSENLSNLTERDWEVISEFMKLDLHFVHMYEDYIQWEYLSENEHLTEDIIDEYTYRLNWERVYRTYPNIDEHFLRKYREFICSVPICENKNISWKLLHKFAKDLAWYQISWVKWITTEDFIREFKDNICWDIIIKNECELSESFIREFIDYFDINQLVNYRLGYQNMKNLLRELKDKIDWTDYLDRGNKITDGYLEVYDYWWGKNRNKGKRYMK